MKRPPETELINVPLVRACIVKWNEGREKHGITFVQDPLPEAFEECVDGINYLDQMEMTSERAEFEDIAYCRNMLMLVADKLQGLWRKRREVNGGK